MRVVEVLKVISFGSETRLYAAARCDLHIGLETVGGYWPIAASYDGLLSTLGLRCPRAAIGQKQSGLMGREQPIVACREGLHGAGGSPMSLQGV